MKNNDVELKAEMKRRAVDVVNLCEGKYPTIHDVQVMAWSHNFDVDKFYVEVLNDFLRHLRRIF